MSQLAWSVQVAVPPVWAAYPFFWALSLTGQFLFSHSCQWFVASLFHPVAQTCSSVFL